MSNPVKPPAPPKEAVDITKIEDRVRIAESLLIDIDDWCEKEYDSGHRKHLGGSVIGRNCSRQLFYSFRWVKKEDYNTYDDAGNVKRSAGQLMRLFQRGHREEIPFTEYLVGIGCRLEATPENQIKVSDVGGHFGGSLDNVGYLPERYGIKDRILFEFKTANMASFNKYKNQVKKNLAANVIAPVFPKVEPKYWAQVCTYGYKENIHYVYYMIVDKNTDELHVEIVKLDHEHGKLMLDKAAMIITTEITPPRVSMHRTNLDCKWCSYRGVCFDGEPMDKNCRSCQHSKPADGGIWLCKMAGDQQIPDDVIPVGCPSHQELIQIG